MNFSQLEDGAAINVSPSVLVDFKFGNKRRNRPSKDYDQIKASIEAQGILQNLVTRPTLRMIPSLSYWLDMVVKTLRLIWHWLKYL